MGLRSIGLATGRVAHAAMQPVQRVLWSRAVAVPGYHLATQAALAWGRLLGGDVRREGDLRVVSGLPEWAFGRGGTTVGATFLTRSNVSTDVLAHEEVHRQQWLRYGLAFIPMYYAAGIDAHANRFEIEAGLERGGYLPRRATRPRRRPTAS
ncbi:hypothetical protein [Agrococcus sp. SGAir0287]|uniref:hypothetical protein n=1 Tax=Agrococcus sp. SGAir0287 TaxID=2070347 RepID=UPI0010CD57E3|nr:hypothetical protein [Agrococcus sp. SGAir0287]QCR19736.1 hypothetical protein C1N71_10125 [Agrococcus sp. SGAir0287]